MSTASTVPVPMYIRMRPVYLAVPVHEQIDHWAVVIKDNDRDYHVLLVEWNDMWVENEDSIHAITENFDHAIKVALECASW